MFGLNTVHNSALFDVVDVCAPETEEGPEYDLKGCNVSDITLKTLNVPRNLFFS